jgi:cell wall assembly regulator SMI1
VSDNSVDEEVAAAWARVEQGLSRVLPASLAQLGEPAGPEAIEAVESALGVELPVDFRASLRIHNGTKWIHPGTGVPSPVPLYWLHDTETIVEMTRMWRDNFDSAAVVVGDLNGDVHWLLDHGQVVRVDVECDQWDVLAPSWTALLHRYAEDLELYAADPASSSLEIDEGLGPAGEWGSTS